MAVTCTDVIPAGTVKVCSDPVEAKWQVTVWPLILQLDGRLAAPAVPLVPIARAAAIIRPAPMAAPSHRNSRETFPAATT
jgi:hypothetical protein